MVRIPSSRIFTAGIYPDSLLTQTMTKSRQVQALVKYLQRPNATHLRTISMVNKTAKTMFTIFRMNINSSLSCRLMSSKQRERLQQKKMKFSWLWISLKLDWFTSNFALLDSKALPKTTLTLKNQILIYFIRIELLPLEQVEFCNTNCAKKLQ